MKLVKQPVDLKSEDVMWEIDDDYSSIRCVRIHDPRSGEATEFGMVYGADKSGSYHAVRPVSDRFQPIGMEPVLAAVEKRFGSVLDFDKQIVRADRFGTLVDIQIPMGDPIVLGKGKAFDVGSEFALQGYNGPDAIQPSLRIGNGYAGLRKISGMVGALRMVCTNGLYVGTGAKIISIHTVHEIHDFVNRLATIDPLGTDAAVRRMFDRKLTGKEIAEIQKLIPAKRRDAFLAYTVQGNGTAWAAYNYVAFMQSHEYSLSREGQLDKTLRSIVKLAA